MTSIGSCRKHKTTKITPRQIVLAYSTFVQKRIDEGWEPAIVTFMFHELSGSKFAVAEQMRNEVERIYGWLLTRRCRRPGQTPTDRLPFFLACPDYPVPKHAKDHLTDIVINDGRHYHAIDLMPPWTRNVCTLSDLVDQHQLMLVGTGRPLARLHVKTILDTPEKAVSYTLKSLTRGRATVDDLIILPRAKSEASAYRS